MNVKADFIKGYLEKLGASVKSVTNAKQRWRIVFKDSAFKHYIKLCYLDDEALASGLFADGLPLVSLCATSATLAESA